jgi:hypothetical protein
MFPGSPDQPVRPGRSFLDILKSEADDGATMMAATPITHCSPRPLAGRVRNFPTTRRRSTIC